MDGKGGESPVPTVTGMKLLFHLLGAMSPKPCHSLHSFSCALINGPSSHTHGAFWALPYLGWAPKRREYPSLSLDLSPQTLVTLTRGGVWSSDASFDTAVPHGPCEAIPGDDNPGPGQGRSLAEEQGLPDGHLSLGEPRHPPLGQEFVHLFHEASSSAPTARPVGIRLGGPAGTGASRGVFWLREKEAAL